MNLHGRRILYASANHAWDYGWTFYQMLAHALARESDVVYVDQPRSVARGGARVRAERVSERLRVLRTPTLPLQRGEMLRRAAARLTARLVGRWATRNAFAPDLVWAYTPRDLPLADRFPDAQLVYWTGDEVVIPGEEELLARADALLCVSRPVYERHAARFAAKAHFVPVACDYDRYRAALDAEPDPQVAALPRPVFGYAGFVNDRLDVDLLTELAGATDGSVVLVGPVRLSRADEAGLAQHANVHVLGMQPPTRVPAAIRAFDVALMPYRDTDFNRNANPAKFYEYLALARPVVSTDIPTLREFTHVASIDSGATFVERALRAAVEAPGDEQARLAVAAAHSFDALLRRLEAVPA